MHLTAPIIFSADGNEIACNSSKDLSYCSNSINKVGAALIRRIDLPGQ